MTFDQIRRLSVALLAVSAVSVRAGVGESAVITLVFPPGARATGLGEAFTGLADDVNATYFNPAGLGQTPMANTWNVHADKSGHRFTSIVARRKKAFDLREEVWAGTNKGVLRYNGRAWQAFDEYMVNEGDDTRSIIERYFGESTNEQWLFDAVNELKKLNKIDGKRRIAVEALLTQTLADSARADAVQLSNKILALDSDERTAAKVFGLISGSVDSTAADTLSDRIAAALIVDDIDLEDLIEIKVPFSIAVNDSVTTLTYDGSNQVWVGTPRGLWRCDNGTWKQFTSLDGLPSDNITALAAGEYGSIAVGTDRGLALFSDGTWKTLDGLPDSLVTAVAFGARELLYVGTQKGLAQRKDSSWVVFDTVDGLLSSDVRALTIDEDGRLWVGGSSGITLYDKVAWKRYKLPESTVYSIADYGKGRIWIGTDRGVLRYRARRPKTDRQGNLVERPPEWKAIHSRNGLVGDEVRGIAMQGKDVWVATDKALNQYDYAQRQAMSFYEQLLPAFRIEDLWHLYVAGAWPTEDWGTIGGMVNYIHMGVNELYDELGRSSGTTRSWEGVFGLSYGLAVKRDLSLGMNIKFVNSALAPGIGSGDEGIGRTFAIDAAMLKRNLGVRGLDLGLMFQNMGPDIFYISAEDPDPIPFTIRLGLGYRALNKSAIHDLNFVLDLYREFVNNDPDEGPDPFYKAIVTDFKDSTGDYNWESVKDALTETQISLGMEYWYIQFLALRLGFLFDYIGERYELTFGLGLRYGSVNVDWSYIVSREGMLDGFLQLLDENKTGATGARHGQWRISLITRF